MTRHDILSLLNSSGIGGHMAKLQQAMLINATEMIIGKDSKDSLDQSPDQMLLTNPKFLLNSVGPAAASEAVDYAITVCKSRGHFQTTKFNGSFVHNVELIQNEPMEGNRDFNSVLRQFLLPRYAYLDFDQIVDPRHQIDYECGYPKFITPIMYRYMYDRYGRRSAGRFNPVCMRLRMRKPGHLLKKDGRSCVMTTISYKCSTVLIN